MFTAVSVQLSPPPYSGWSNGSAAKAARTTLPKH